MDTKSCQGEARDAAGIAMMEEVMQSATIKKRTLLRMIVKVASRKARKGRRRGRSASTVLDARPWVMAMLWTAAYLWKKGGRSPSSWFVYALLAADTEWSTTEVVEAFRRLYPKVDGAAPVIDWDLW